jgi:glycosyltransferase involved in cell wall biosynthesis
MKVALIPEPENAPPNGGVRQHCLMLRKHLSHVPGVLFSGSDTADVVHVQSAYPSRRVDVYTCHGGFLPEPITIVLRNLKEAKAIISVARWIVDRFFPEHLSKTTIIPNGVDLSEWNTLPHNTLGLEPGYVLTKGYNARREHWLGVFNAARSLPNVQFVSLGAPQEVGVRPLPNLIVWSTLSSDEMKGLINDCGCYVSCSSEVNPVLVLEAWAARKPVVALDMHGNQETIDASCGVLYRTQEGLVEALHMARAGAKVLGERGRARVEEKHDWRKLAEQTVVVYREVLGLPQTTEAQDVGKTRRGARRLRGELAEATS